MKTYRFTYHVGPHVNGLKELHITAPSMIVAFEKADEQLRLKYTHHELHSVNEMSGIFSSDSEELYREVEARR